MRLNVLILIVVLFICSCKKKVHEEKESTIENKPNIVFLFADDWGKYASIYAKHTNDETVNSVIKTPNFDSIAKNGALFLNAFVPAPSCTPCRSSILSGQYFYKTGMGAILHEAEWDSTIPSYPLILKNNGYHIGFTYKVWSPGSPEDAPYGGEKYAFETAGKNFNQFSFKVSQSDNKDEKVKELLDEVRSNFNSFLNANQKEKPFCYWFGPTNTHRSWARGSGMGIWGMNPDNLKGKMPSFLPDIPEIREDFNDYLGEVLAWDKAIGVILEELVKNNLMDNTIIVVSGDHGIPGFPRAKSNLYDLGTSVALAIQWPEKIKKGMVVDKLINLMDLAPTFLDVAQVEVPKVMDGRSLLPLFENEKTTNKYEFVLTGRERHVATAREGNLPYPQRALRTKDYLYIKNLKPNRWPIGTISKALRDIDGGPTKDWYIKNYDSIKFSNTWELAFGKRPEEELYDISKDPYQTTNLAYDKEFLVTKNELSFKMDSVLVKTEDPRYVIDENYFDKMPFTKTSKRMLDVQKKQEEAIINLYNKHGIN